MHDERIYRLALPQVEGIGTMTAKALVEHFGTATKVFEASAYINRSIPADLHKALKSIAAFNDFDTMQKECDFMDKNGIHLLHAGMLEYPKHLLNCADAPFNLFYKGTCDLNRRRKVAIVGTRKATDYGRQFTHKLVEELAAYDCTIVSGLAYGIDVTAHRAALKYNLPTIGVLGQGLDQIYPASHTNVANDMLEHGALLSEYMSGTEPLREHFPMRNRIVAGMCDCVIVIESLVKGGSMLTAEVASTYNRDVFAVPGRSDDAMSSGCHYLIKHNKAALIDSGADVATNMGWQTHALPKAVQTQMFLELPPDEKVIVDILQQREQAQIDELIVTLPNYTPSALASHLLMLELKGVIRTLPGKIYKLN